MGGAERLPNNKCWLHDSGNQPVAALAIIIALCLLLTHAARAQTTNSWINGSGNWETSTNWSLGTAPSPSDAADLITNTTTKMITIDTNTPVSNLTISNLVLSAPAGSTNTLGIIDLGQTIFSNPFQMETLFVGSGGILFITNSGVAIALSNTISNGRMVNIEPAGSIALLPVDDFLFTVTGPSATFSNFGAVVFGDADNNTVVVSNGGRIDTGDLYIGLRADNPINPFGIDLPADFDTVTIIGTNSQANAGLLSIGDSGSSNAFIIGDGGTMRVQGILALGSSANTISNLITLLPGGTLIVGNNVYVGNTNDTQAAMQFVGGNSSLLSNLVAGSFPSSTGTVLIAGGQLVVTNGVIGIGNDASTTNGFGYGQMTVSNSSVLANQILLGSSAGGRGNLTIQSNAVVSLVGSNALLVPDDVDIDGGELNIDNGEIVCGSGTNFPGSLTMAGGVATVSEIDVGSSGSGTLTISGGQMTVSDILDLGSLSGSAGSVWMIGGTLTAGVIEVGVSGVGQLSLSNNGIIQVSFSFSVGASGAAGAAGTLTVAGGSLISSVPVYVGAGSVWVSGGQLQASSLLIGYNNYGVGELTISNGSVQANSLILTNGANSRIALVGGTLESGGTVVTNNQRFVVGNGINSATFTLGAGGTHWFANGLEITSNATLSGCGTINGSVLVDTGGVVVANCGTLTFNNIVTNNGVLLADGGSTLETYSNLVNNGTIDAINGSTNFHGAFVNRGTVLTSANVKISQVAPSGQNFVVKIQSVTGHTYRLQYTASMLSPTWTDTGASQSGTGGVLTFTDYGALANPPRFYRVLATAP